MRYAVQFSAAAAEDLQQLFDFVLQRELDSAARALQAIKNGIRFLESFPFACRKVGTSPFLRELRSGVCQRNCQQWSVSVR